MTALVEERQSQICLGLDPDPSALAPEAAPEGDVRDIAERAAVGVYEECKHLIEAAGSACVAVKPQLAYFERLGQHGWWALDEVRRAAHRVGLLVIADGKRGDVPVTAAAYGQALVGQTETPWGVVAGLGADAFTANPLLGDDAVDVLVEAAAAASAGVFLLVRTSNPGASRLQDRPLGDRPLHEELAALVAESASKLIGDSGLSGLGAVVGATAPQHMGRLRELMPDSVFLIPGVGAQGGKPEELGPAIARGRPASILVAASRSIARTDDPGAAAAQLRDAVWDLEA